MRKNPWESSDHEPVSRGAADALAAFVGFFLSALVTALVDRLVGPLAERLATEFERQRVAGGERLSLTQAARRAKVRPACVSAAVRLPSDVFGHLPSRVEGVARGALAGAEHRSVLVADLLAWKASGAARVVLHLSAESDSTDASAS